MTRFLIPRSLKHTGSRRKLLWTSLLAVLDLCPTCRSEGTLPTVDGHDEPQPLEHEILPYWIIRNRGDEDSIPLVDLSPPEEGFKDLTQVSEMSPQERQTVLDLDEIVIFEQSDQNALVKCNRCGENFDPKDTEQEVLEAEQRIIKKSKGRRLMAHVCPPMMLTLVMAALFFGWISINDDESHTHPHGH
eukprot:Blabericola_migrator_1__7558@NODE_3860_length_1462_cov_27_457348_g2391_i0_p1_GENE_NODE_3860_length_1462_cov_27_457348_g2391_i0NODE_3860_length_1462_cov_27_457348_g2391_i0_p1_ORF_typecomplete_len189_score29_90zftrcl/PF13451_6/61zftrcl/PF13451_6/0_66zinc_ribbon_15/PF17032_5/1_4e03zinc_ribbon_15/PF17032_5/0_079DUF2387/PF09526_10/3_4e02DUF2387/PF09526_10/0_37Lar_restr_allev/PF14354_6/0_99zf_UBZ/PF18439_1/2_2e02zf_UBZ/PF18439_1/0_49_NODE_3860_length_1462_cov_27_457348_g2391_i0326892